MRRSNLIIIGNIMAAILLFGTAGCRRQRKTEEGVSSESAQKMELTANPLRKLGTSITSSINL